MLPGTMAEFTTLGSTKLEIANALTGLHDFDFNYQKDIFFSLCVLPGVVLVSKYSRKL